MRFATSLSLLTILGAAAPAFGQALDDEGKPVPTTDASASPTVLVTEPKVEYGADLRIRQVFVPKGMIELFVDRAAGGASNTGIGIDLVRRRGNLELQFGIEYVGTGGDSGEGVYERTAIAFDQSLSFQPLQK